MTVELVSRPAIGPMVDPFGRHVTYLRVSVTDRCDFRCVYCMSEHMTFLPKTDLLTLEELDRLCTAFIAKGVRKLRITGGEPLVRKNILWLLRALARHLETGALDELTLTTNASQLTRFAADLKALVDTVREGGIATLALSPERRELFDRMQALMAVLEGYAEHVMDAVGGDVLDDLPALRGALNRRRRERSGFLRLFERLIGMDLKLRQYEQGKAFCDGVVARAGIDGLNRVWHGPESMPSIAELNDPVGWLARTEQRRLRPSA